VAANGAGSSVLSWTATAGTDKLAVIYHWGPHSPGALPKFEKSRYYVHLAGEGGTVTITPLTPGRHTFWGCVCDEDNGLESTWVNDDADVT
jgi:hypothetical protein